MEKYGFVYIWRDRKHKRSYVGSHWGLETDGYICSSRWMRKAYRRRPEDFKRRVVARVTTDRSDLLTEEQRWLHMMREGELRVRYYNITRSVKNFKSWWVNEDGTYLSVIEKNRKSHTGKFHSEESKQRMRVAQSERKTISEEVRQRMRDSHLGKKQSKETVEKRVNAIKGS